MFLKLLNFKVETIYYKIHSEVVKKNRTLSKTVFRKEWNAGVQFANTIFLWI